NINTTIGTAEQGVLRRVHVDTASTGAGTMEVIHADVKSSFFDAIHAAAAGKPELESDTVRKLEGSKILLSKYSVLRQPSFTPNEITACRLFAIREHSKKEKD